MNKVQLISTLDEVPKTGNVVIDFMPPGVVPVKNLPLNLKIFQKNTKILLF